MTKAREDEPLRRPFKPPKGTPEAERLRMHTLAAELDPDRLLCPVCASAWVLDNLAGRKYGVCETCFRRAKRDAALEERRQLEAGREYDRARQELRRAREELGLPPDGKRGERRKPLF